VADALPAAAVMAERCSVQSAERGESMLGTAFEQPGVLLVEQPGPWGHPGLRASHFDADVAQALEARAAEAGLRLLAIRRPGRTPEGIHRSWAVAIDGELTWSTYERDAELLDVPLDGSAGRRDDEPLYLVCAHSKRDMCCALRGRPLAADLEALRPGRVWECSHTGGHRFAPIVLALPVGALYGRVPAEAAADIVAATERDQVLPALLRGVIGFPPVEQTAIAHALATLRMSDIDAVAVIGSDEVRPGVWVVRVVHASEQYDVSVAVETVSTPLPSCGKPTPKAEPQFTPLGVARI
jgi:hypothetical protein